MMAQTQPTQEPVQSAPASASTAFLAKALPLGSMLARIEGIKGTGSVLIRQQQGQVLGSFEVSQGRICSAATPARHEKIGTCLLRKRPELKDKIDGVADAARPQRKWLGEALIEAGLATEAEVRDCLIRQAASAFMRMVENGAGSTSAFEATRGKSTFPHRISFSPSEIYVATGELSDNWPEDEAQRHYREWSARGEATLLLLRSTSRAFPPMVLAARGFETASVIEIRTLARTVGEACRNTFDPGGGPQPGLVSYTMERGKQRTDWVFLNGQLRTAVYRLSTASDLGLCLSSGLRLLRGGGA
ncbi:MAG: hypothetical protein ICCCNLDF_01933 [Planctomycetes bacterium]|nr:hypothetical protein [Planctomycetota bacterium]